MDVGAVKAPTIRRSQIMQAITTIGLDIAKSVFQVHGVDEEGNVLYSVASSSDISVSGVLLYPVKLASRTTFEKGLNIFFRLENSITGLVRCHAYLTLDIVLGLTP